MNQRLHNRGVYAHAAFCLVLLASYLYTMFGIAHLSDLHEAGHTALRVAGSLIELGFVWATGSYIINCWQKKRQIIWFAAYMFMMAVVSTVYFVQIYSLYLSNNFVSVLAMQNLHYATLTSSTIEWLILATDAFLLTILGVCVWQSTCIIRPRRPAATAAFLALAAIYAAAYMQQRQRVALEPNYRQLPFASMAVNTRIALGYGLPSPPTTETNASAANATCWSDPEADRAADYPFQKSSVFSSTLPFPRKETARVSRPNVILIFTEGTSARLIGAYGGSYSGLTPNIDRLANRSMRITDYFNHTAPTFRGIIGQSTSGYPRAGGSGDGGWTIGSNARSLTQIRRQSLANILSAKGYTPYFFEPEHRGDVFEKMLESIGFENLYGYEKIQSLLGGKVLTQDQTNQLSDNSLFDGLTAFLKSNHDSHPRQPLFIGLYNIGTHAFIPMVKGGTAYGDGKSEVLNKLHNYDASLGQFLDYFYNSPYASNTILILTADHATYPDRPYRDVAGKDLRPYFVDRIPLIIYDPTHELPSQFEAHGRNSLALAPTLLQLLGIRHAENSFLGDSLFEKRDMPLGVSALGDDFYATTTEGTIPFWAIPSEWKAAASCEKRLIEMYYKVESENRLFKPTSSSFNTANGTTK